MMNFMIAIFVLITKPCNTKQQTEMDIESTKVAVAFARIVSIYINVPKVKLAKKL